MPLLDAQRLNQKTGNIRLGKKVPDKSANGFHPAAISTFRFTTPSQHAAMAVARHYGGDIAQWVDDGTRLGWEVITDRKSLEVLIPPGQIMSQWYEMWGRGKTLLRRCDSQHERVSNGVCLCPHAEDTTSEDEVRTAALLRDELAAQGKACSRYTRLSVQIPALPDIGVWLLVTGGFYAAGEMAGKAELIELARRAGVTLPAILRIDERERRVQGQPPRKYVVPVLELIHSVAQIVNHEVAAGITAAVDALPAAAMRAALTAGQPAAERLALTSSQPPADMPADEVPLPPEPLAEEPNRTAGSRAAAEGGPRTAQELAMLALEATTWQHIEILISQAKRYDLADHMVLLNPDRPEGEPEEWEDLKSLLSRRHIELSAAA
jgi:hypothetical protein